MATGVVTTSVNLGGITGIALTSVALGESAGLDAFQTIVVLHLAMSLVGTLITTRVEPWPVSEEDARAAVSRG